MISTAFNLSYAISSIFAERVGSPHEQNWWRGRILPKLLCRLLAQILKEPTCIPNTIRYKANLLDHFLRRFPKIMLHLYPHPGQFSSFISHWKSRFQPKGNIWYRTQYDFGVLLLAFFKGTASKTPVLLSKWVISGMENFIKSPAETEQPALVLLWMRCTSKICITVNGVLGHSLQTEMADSWKRVQENTKCCYAQTVHVKVENKQPGFRELWKISTKVWIEVKYQCLVL